MSGAGERRSWPSWRRCPALVRAREDSASLELALIENMVREDLNPIEEARACAALVEELGLTREEVGRRIGRSRVAVSNLLRLLELPDEAIEMLEEGLLSEGHGRALLLAEGHDARRRLARECREQQWSVRTLEERARDGNAAGAGRKGGAGGAGRAHPDQVQAAADIAAALGRVLGAEVKVKPARGGLPRGDGLRQPRGGARAGKPSGAFTLTPRRPSGLCDTVAWPLP